MKPTRSLLSFLFGSVFLTAQMAQAATYYWDANGNLVTATPATGTWGTNDFWSTDSTGATATSAQTIDNTSDLFFSAASNSTGGIVTVSGTQSAHSITFDDATGGITLSGGTAINLGNSTAGSGLFFTSVTGSANTISTGIILNSAATDIAISNSGTALQTIGAITGSAAGLQTVTVGASGTGGITLGGIIGNGGGGGTVGLTVNSSGAGITTLAGANTYTGATTISAGTLRIGPGGSLLGAGTYAGAISIATGGTFHFNGTSNQTYNSNFSGSTGGNVLLSNVNPTSGVTLTLGGTSASGWSGSTTVNAGMTLALGTTTVDATSRALLNTSGITMNGGGLTLNYVGSASMDRVSDSASIAVNGGGTITIGTAIGALSETMGGVTLNSGQLNLNYANNPSSGGTITFSGGLNRVGTTSAMTVSSSANGSWRFTGAANTAANEIIGPWATVGGQNGTAAQTDYAIFTGGNGTVAARGIAASAQSTWSTAHAATSNYTLTNAAGSAANGKLSLTRSVNTVRNFGATNSTATATNGGVASLDYFTVAGHTFANGDVVSASGTEGLLVGGNAYYVINANVGGAGRFQLASTSGGSPVDLTGVTNGTITGGITLSTGNNLETYGILNGNAAALAIGASGTGALTTPSGGGNLFLTTGSGAIFINAPITDSSDSAAVTVVRNGSAGRLNLSGYNTFTGGLVLNAGVAGSAVQLFGSQSFTGGITLNGGGLGENSSNGTPVTLAASLNGNAITVNGPSHLVVEGTLASTSTITINPNAVLKLGAGNSALTVTGVVSGSGVLDVNANNFNSGYSVNLTNAANTFSGDVVYAENNGTRTLSVNSIGDSGKVIFGLGTAAQIFALNSSATAPLTFNTRQFELAGTTAGTIANNGAQTFTVNTNLAFSGAGARTLNLETNIGSVLKFGGNLSDNGASTLSLNVNAAATNGGTVILSGTNTYSGATTITTDSGGGFSLPNTVVFQGMQALSPNSAVSFARGNNGSFAVRLLDDAAGVINAPTNFTYADTSTDLSFFVGNNNTLNGGNSSGTTTGSTIALGNLTLTAAAGRTYNITGANGYRLQFNNVNLPTTATPTTGFNPTSAPLTIAGTVRQASSANTGAITLTLGGTAYGIAADSYATGNLVSGNIMNSADASARLLILNKTGGSTWTVSGTNSYTGGTTVSAGLLRFTGNSSAANGAVAVSGGAIGGTGSLGGAVTISGTGGIDLRDGAVGTFALSGTLTASGGASNNLYFDLGNGGSSTDKITVGSTTNFGASGPVIHVNQLGGLAGTAPTGGPFNLIESTGTLTGGANAVLNTTRAFRQLYSLGVSGNNLQLTIAAGTAGDATPTQYWKGATSVWTGANWNTGATSGTAAANPGYNTNVVFATTTPAAGNLTNTLGADYEINSLNVNLGVGAVAINAGNMLTIDATNANSNTAGNGITVNNVAGTTIATKVGIAQSQTWTVGASAALTVSGVVSDFGLGYGITKAGTGTLTLSGANTFSGALVVNAGTLSLGTANGLGLGTPSSTTFTGTSKLLFNVSGGTLTFLRPVAIDPGVIATFDKGGGGSGGTFTFDDVLTGSGTLSFSTGGGGSGGGTLNFNNTANTFTGTVETASDYATNGGTTFNVVSLGDGGKLRHAGTAIDLAINYTGFGATFDTRQIEMASTRNITLSNNGVGGALVFNQALSVTAAGNKTLTLAGSNLSNNTFGGAISDGTGAVITVTKTGAGTWVLSGNNTHTGGTNITAGTLALGANDRLLNTGAVTVSGGTFDIRTFSDTVGAVTLTGGTISGTTGVLSGTPNLQNGTVSAILGGSSALLKDGVSSGIVTLSGVNTYTGDTILSGGTLSVGLTSHLGDASSDLIFNGGNLQIALGNLVNFSGIGHAVSFTSGTTVGLDINNAAHIFTADQILSQGGGGLLKAGAGTLRLSQTNTYTGSTLISAGTLQITGSGSLGAGSYAGTIGNAGTLQYSSSANQTLSGVISGTGSLFKDTSAASTLTLSGANIFSGTTTVSAGTLTLANALALQNSALVTTSGTSTMGTFSALTLGGLSGATGDLGSANVLSGYTGNVAALTLNTVAAGPFTYGGVISDGAVGGTSLTKNGTGTQVLQGANTYTGATNINAGTLELSGSGSILGTSDITFNNGSLTLTNTAVETGSGRINANAITSNGGTLTYNNTSGANVYAETIGSVALTVGQLNIVQAVDQAGGGSQTLTLGGLTHPGTTSAVTFSSAGTRTTKNMIVVTGATATAANEIIAPWATIGTTAALQTDYAIYNGSAQVVDRNIAASAQSTWSTATSATSNYTVNALNGTAGLTLTGGAGRNINSLRSISAANTVSANDFNDNFTLNGHTFAANDAVVFSSGTMGNLTLGAVYFVRDVSANAFKVSTTPGGTAVNLSSGATQNISATGALLVSTGNNLGTLGILNGVTSTMYIAATGTGVVTLPTTTADNLHVTAGSGAITIFAPINDNTASGVLTLVKNGTGTLTLSNTNTFSGGLVINAGNVTLGTSGVDSLGASGSSVTINATTNLTTNGNPTLNKSFVLNNRAMLNMTNGTNATTISGAVTGTGGIGPINAGSIEQRTLSLTSTANTFTGPIMLNWDAGNNSTIAVNSLSDAAGSGTINMFSNGSAEFMWGGASSGAPIASLVLNNRQFQISGGTNLIIKSGSSAANFGMTINTDLLVTGIGAKTLSLRNSSTAINTFAGKIVDGPGAVVSVTRDSDAGVWALTGANTYTGATNLSTGILQISSLANGGLASSIGASSAFAGNLVLNGGTLRYTGAAVSTDRLFSLQASSTLDSSGTGAVNFTNPGAMGFNGGVAAKTLTLTGTNTGNNTIAAGIADNTAATAITKTGIGTWVLSGANTNTGATTISGGGKLILDYGTNDNSKIAGVLTLSNGAGDITLRGGSHLEAVTSTTFATGATGGGHTSITREVGSTAKISMGAINRGQNSGVTMSLAADGLATTTSGNSNGILSGGIIVGSNWAKVSAGDIVALTAGDYTTLTTAATTNTLNYQLSGALDRAAASVNSLRIIGSNDTLKISSGNLLVGQVSGAGGAGNGATGGILYTGGGDYTITSTTGTGTIGNQSNNQDLIIHTLADKLTLDMIVALGNTNGNLAKSGAGTLVLTKANTHQGATFVNQGVLQLGNNAAAGQLANTLNAGVVVANNAALELANNVAIGAEALTITGTGISNGGALRSVSTNITSTSYAGLITIGAGGARINNDSTAAALTLSGGITTSLFNDVTFGGAGNTTVSTAAISGAGGVTKDGVGMATLTAANTYTGATTVSVGTLNVSGAGAINTSSFITVAAGGALRYNSSTALTKAPTLNGTGTGSGQRAVLGGGDSTGTNGVINASVTLDNLGDTLSPGNSPGILPFAIGQTWASNSYDWEINDWANSVAGTDIDHIQITGALDLSAVAADQYLLNVLSLTSGNVAGDVDAFTDIDKSWTILTASGGITGFDVNEWDINTAGFTNNESGTWSISQDTNNLVLTYTAIPEPGAVFLGSMGLLLILRRRR